MSEIVSRPKTSRTKKATVLTAAAVSLAALGTTIGLTAASADAAPAGTSKGRVIAKSLNYRVGPSVHVGSLGSYHRGKVVTISCKLPGTSVDGNKLWYRVASGYWVSARYVDNIGAAPKRCHRGSAMGTTTAAVNVRQAPSTQDRVVGSIGRGVSTVDVLCKVSGGNVGNNTTWFATAWGNGSQIGYLHSEFIKVRGTVKSC